MTKPGALLEVHILPEEHELLDWDSRVGEHPREVIDKLEASKLLPNYNPMQLRGEELYSHLVGENMQKAVDSGLMGQSAKYEAKRLASAALHEAGIPGIRYLDAGSRAAGEGTSNYVIFHPDNLRIIGRNGQRLEPVDHDPFAP
jgi:hypothetical protein